MCLSGVSEGPVLGLPPSRPPSALCPQSDASGLGALLLVSGALLCAVHAPTRALFARQRSNSHRWKLHGGVAGILWEYFWEFKGRRTNRRYFFFGNVWSDFYARVGAEGLCLVSLRWAERGELNAADWRPCTGNHEQQQQRVGQLSAGADTGVSPAGLRAQQDGEDCGAGGEQRRENRCVSVCVCGGVIDNLILI